MARPFPSPTKQWHSTTYASISPTRPELSAAGKTILVTGGGTGIGAETALYFAKAGAVRIALLGRREQPLLSTKKLIQSQFPSIEIFVYSTDVTKKYQVDAAFDKFFSTGDFKLDVLVSNAASTGPVEPLTVVDPALFLENVQQNIAASVYTAQAFVRHAAPEAVVVNVSSNAAHVNIAPAFHAYSVAKWAIYRVWDSLGFALPNINVFHTQPGVVDTDMNKEAGGVKALGYEDDVSLPASFHVWLASPEARFLKNKFLYTSWDVDELKARAKELKETAELSLNLVGWPFDRPGWQAVWKS
ncbi:hypothetical protein BJX70DRAFT_354175 [Aspergillus crustosus]